MEKLQWPDDEIESTQQGHLPRRYLIVARSSFDQKVSEGTMARLQQTTSFWDDWDDSRINPDARSLQTGVR